MRTRVKFCGITRPGDAGQAVAAGADAIGLVFHEPSPRNLEADQAALIAAGVPAFVTRVGLFVDPDPARVRSVLDRVGLDLLQFHGNEPAEFCRQFGRPYLKAIRMRPGLDPLAEMAAWPDAAGILLDAWRPDAEGGTGERFDWDRAPAERLRPLVLAGGLTPDNVAEAIRRVRPYAVDVSTGVESAPGIKDPQRMAAFMRGVRDGDDSR